MTAQTSDFIHKYFPADSPDGVTLLLLHGTGGNEMSLASLGQSIDREAGQLSPRGKVSEGGAPRFFRRIAEGVYDMEDLAVRSEELADWIEAARAEYGIAADKLVAVGYSNGANIAASVMLRRPGVITRAVLVRAMMPVEGLSPDLSGTKILMLAGQYDPLVPAGESQRLAQAFEQFGADVTLETFPTDHGITNEDLVAARTWIQENAR
jgi:phospholipase/carboxylesterase